MSKETKWTPGPWVVNEKFSSPHLLDGDYCAITAGSGIYGAGCYEHDGFEFTGYIGMANASLIAAAPDLYEALEHILSLPRGTSGRIILELHDEEEVRKALAKARGEQ